MSKLRHKAGLPRRPPISFIWDELSQQDRHKLVAFAQVYIDKRIHMGSLPFMSVGRFYDKMDYANHMDVRAVLKWAISMARKKHMEGRHATANDAVVSMGETDPR